MDIDAILKEVGTPAKAPSAPPKPRRRVPGVKPRDWTLPGFGPLTRITTALGDVPAQALRERDLVRTRSGDFKPIVWLDRIVLDEEFISLHPDALPVHIKPNALGRGIPSHDVYLAPRQPIDNRANKLAGLHDVAMDLIGRPGVFRKAEAMYTYTLFHLGEPQVIQASKMFLQVDP
ncbi:MAG: Hint domain-containing protein [Paracoccaceae bacterium]|nr:Hint domain-containing protein [Paracoccaceae bacterium]